MPTEALSCPTCSANDSSRPDAHGIHTCVYCGVRYRLTGGTPRPLAAPGGAKPKPGGAVIGALAVVGVGLVVAGALTFVGSKPTTSSAPIALASDATTREVSAAPPPTTSTPQAGVTPANPVASVDAPVSVAVVPEPPAAAHFELTHRRPSSGSTFYAAGWVTNDSPYPIDKPKIVAVMKDASGAEVGTAFGFADDVLDAGAKDAAEVLVMNPPPFATISFEIAPRKATYIPTRVVGLKVEPGPVGPGSFGSGFSVNGKVVHGGTVPARFVHVRALAFDAAGTLLGIDDTYADVEVLQPGATARFDMTMFDLGATPARWEFTVTGASAT